MPWYTFFSDGETGQTVTQDAFYTNNPVAVTQIRCANPSQRTAYTRIYTPNGTTLKAEFTFPPGSANNKSAQPVAAGVVTPVQDPDNAGSWGIAEYVESGLI